MAGEPPPLNLAGSSLPSLEVADCEPCGEASKSPRGFAAR
jgi:hypothetical protein